MKKLVATILIALLTMSCLLAFVGCNNNGYDGKDDTNNSGSNDVVGSGSDDMNTNDDSQIFIGAVSKTTYSSREEAVKGFLHEEISGQAYIAEFIGYTKIADLSQGEITKIAIDEELKDGIISVEKGKVEYIESENCQEKLVSILANETYEREVYIIAYQQNGEIKYRFYAPAEEIGQTPSASAFDYIIDANRYSNSTFSWTTTENGLRKYFYSFNLDDNYVLIEANDDGGEYQMYYIGLDNAQYIVFPTYFESGIDYYAVPYENESVEYNSNQLMSYIIFYGYFCDIESYYGYLIKGHFNHFIRTEVGYSMDKPIQAFGGTISKFDIEISDGYIVGMSIVQIMEENGNTISVEFTFTDIGTTKVDVPKEAIDAIKAYIAENN